MAFEAVVVDPLREDVPAGWAALAAEIGLPPGWDPAIQRTLAWYGTHRPLMALVHEDGRPCALFCARHVSVSRRRRFLRLGDRAGPGLVECHLPPAVTSPGHAFHSDLDVAARRQAVTAFERGIAARLGWLSAGVVYRQVDAEHLPAFQGAWRVVRSVQPDAVVRNEWHDIDDYLRTRPQRERAGLRRARRLVAADPAVRPAIEDRVDGVEASRLLHVVHARYQRSPRVFPAAYYDLLAGRPDARYFTYRDSPGRLLAYGLMVDAGPVLHAHGWGNRDAADGGRPHLYFDHWFREVAYLIEHGRERFHMGKGMFELKERFGARPEPLYAVASVRRPR